MSDALQEGNTVCMIYVLSMRTEGRMIKVNKKGLITFSIHVFMGHDWSWKRPYSPMSHEHMRFMSTQLHFCHRTQMSSQLFSKTFKTHALCKGDIKGVGVYLGFYSFFKCVLEGSSMSREGNGGGFDKVHKMWEKSLHSI